VTSKNRCAGYADIAAGRDADSLRAKGSQRLRDVPECNRESAEGVFEASLDLNECAIIN